MRSHQKTVREEFTRQSAAYSRELKKAAPPAVDYARFAEVESGHRVLDVGAGTGFLALALARQARNTFALDLTEAMLSRARENAAEHGIAAIRCLIGEAERLPFRPETFDRVCCQLSLHHFSSAESPLKEMARVARRKGKVLVSDITTSEDPRKAVLHNRIEKLRDPSHAWMFPKSEILRLCEGAGLHVEKIEEWEVERTFTGWFSVTAHNPSGEEVRDLLRESIPGDGAGLSVREEKGELRFTHSWLALLLAPRS